jgi:hypothetical protein
MVDIIRAILRQALLARVELDRDDAQLILTLLERYAAQSELTESAMDRVERITERLEQAYPKLHKGLP